MIDATQIFDGTFSGTPAVPTGDAITVSRASTNVLDMLAARDLGAGSILGVHIAVLQAFATLTSLDIEFQVSADNTNWFTILAEKTIPVAQLIVGAPIFRYDWPLNQVFNATAGVLKAPGRYYRLNYTVNGSTATAGTVFSYVTPVLDRQEYYSIPENYVTH